jgi:hypothetical protein
MATERIVSQETRAGDPIADAARSALRAREERALALYRERGHLIEWYADALYYCPSSDGERFYVVDYQNETCTCEDHRWCPERACKHLLCIGIAHAKRRRRRQNFIAALCAEPEEH